MSQTKIKSAKNDAFADAKAKAESTRKPQGVWLVGPDRWQVDEFRKGDEDREGFYSTVYPTELE